MTLRDEVIFTEAVEQVEAIMASESSDEIATRLEQISKIEDLALACLMLLVLKAKGHEVNETGVELANTQPTFHDLILPPGVS
jgi:hypothetical protein